ncbi:MAG: hypothetical protein ACYTKD_20190 [Planctomycetota bacterium]|jgi:hypothetical protein
MKKEAVGEMKQEAVVRRIAVDERLDETLIRFVIAPLAGGVEKITDSLEDWRPEEEELVTPKTFLRCLGLKKDPDLLRLAYGEIVGEPGSAESSAARAGKRRPAAEKMWRALAEGQVFIVGRFRLEGERYEPKAIAAGDGPFDFLRIDRVSFVKDALKKLYSDALRGREADSV